MTNNYDSAYDELPSCCCDGMEENDRLDDLLERLTASGPKCNAVSASETHEIVNAVLELQRKNAELRAMVNEFRGVMWDLWDCDLSALPDELVRRIHHAHVNSGSSSYSLADHDMRIAEKVRGKCVDVVTCDGQCGMDIGALDLEELLK